MSVESAKKINKFEFEISVSGHKVMTDVQEKLGGQNRAPDPHDYLLAALAGCTVITIQMYADRKQFPLDYADVKIKILQEGAENKIHREIKLIGDHLTVEQKNSLFAIAEKCPVHHFLQRGAAISSTLSE